MMTMDGKQGLVFGVANERSYATHIAKALADAGAEGGFSHLPGEKNERRTANALESIGVSNPWLQPCDVANDDDLDAIFERFSKDFGRLDFVVHSVAFADKSFLELGKFIETPREVWNQALDISAYSLLGMARRARPLMTDGGAVVSMSYLGGEKVVPGYNVMGIAKAALEHATRYLAMELGREGIRVNAISGGPLRTISAMGVGGIEAILEHTRRMAPLNRTVEGEEVGSVATFLLSDAAGGITGEIVHVDVGMHVYANTPDLQCYHEDQCGRLGKGGRSECGGGERHQC
ncbi:MAG: enoyl-ACP reductase [Phycisphaerae bacterium]